MTTRMTPEECAACMKALQPKIDNYAELLVRDGAAVQPGQELVVQVPVAWWLPPTPPAPAA